MSSSNDSGYAWSIFLGIAPGFIMALLDVSVMNVALPAVVRDFHSNLSVAAWVTTAHGLAFGAVLITAGRLADQFGRRRLYLIGLSTFTLISAACALAPGLGSLIAFRAAQGAAGGILIPAAMAIVVNAFAGERLGSGLGAIGSVSASAAALGPPLGGILTQAVSWRLVFWVNLPIGIVGLLTGRFVIPETRDPKADSRIDVLGMALLTSGLFMLTLGLNRGESWGWRSGRMILVIGGAVGLLVMWLIAQKRGAGAMVDLALFRDRDFGLSGAVLFLTSIGFGGALFLIPQYLVQVTGRSEATAGLAVAPVWLAATALGWVAGRLLRLSPPRWPIGIGTVAMSGALLMLSRLTTDYSPNLLVGGMVVLGVGLGLSLTPANAAGMRAVDGRSSGVATGVLTMFRTFGLAFGVILFVAVLNAATVSRSAGPLNSDQSSAFGSAFKFGAFPVLLALIPALCIRTGRFAVGSDTLSPIDAHADTADDSGRSRTQR